ncbi:hypothetical protein BGZ95_000729 [Linnemannia exigua]|uniref:F-box domain-containing protein n=1 Tax=Linnemannia exigua TaxID=604196 RepID=A0AAD4H391_9FUNG|nr:hypothetical protein BGZ95_000729 [Linnemannia exigua]
MEIVLAFGEYLDKPSLLASLQVCRQWNQALYPFTWVILNKQQWCHPSFPIAQSTKLSPPFDTKDEETHAAKCLSCLRQTRSFEWNDASDMDREGWREHIHVTYSNYEVSLPSLEVFHLMPNLTRLWLIIAGDGPTCEDLVSMLNPLHLLNLRDLVLDLLDTWTRPGMNIRQLYPILSRLEEVEIHGVWFYGPGDINQADELLPSRSGEPWRIKKLTVDWVHLIFLDKCLALEHLSAVYPFSALVESDWSGGLQARISRILQMSHLTTITFRGSRYGKDEYRIQGPMGPDVVWMKTTLLGLGVPVLSLSEIVDLLD